MKTSENFVFLTVLDIIEMGHWLKCFSSYFGIPRKFYAVLVRNYFFSTYVKFSAKLLFLTP